MEALEGRPACRAFIISSQIGAAPDTPLTFFIGSPEKFPTQTPTVYFSEYPRHQLSRMSLLVPVLTAVQNRVDKGFSSPKVALRASRSERIWETIKAAFLSKDPHRLSSLLIQAKLQFTPLPPIGQGSVGVGQFAEGNIR